MRQIKKMAEQIRDELHDVDKYIKCAIANKAEYPKIAQNYYDMAQDEMTHAQMLHSGVMILIDEIKDKKSEIPPFMLELWEEEHQHYIDKAAKLKHKLSLYSNSK